MKRTLLILLAALIVSLLVFETYVNAQEGERWVSLGGSKDSISLYVEVTTYNPVDGAWYLFVTPEKKEIFRIVDEKENRAVCFTAFTDLEKKMIYNTQERHCVIATAGTVSETIFLSLLVMRNEYEKRNKVIVK